MRLKYVLASAASVVFFLSILPIAESVTTVVMNTTIDSAWWNETVVFRGSIYNETGAVGSATVNVTIGSVHKCGNTSSSDGSFSCSFQMPLEVGRYNLTVNITNTTDSVFNYTMVSVKPTYGESPSRTTPRSIFQIPILMQEPSGSIKIVLLRVLAWRGQPS